MTLAKRRNSKESTGISVHPLSSDGSLEGLCLSLILKRLYLPHMAVVESDVRNTALSLIAKSSVSYFRARVFRFRIGVLERACRTGCHFPL